MMRTSLCNQGFTSKDVLRKFTELRGETLLILAHLDDEFAVAPLIRVITKAEAASLVVIFCAERITSPNSDLHRRRIESLKSLNLLGCNEGNIIYLNDYFLVNDLEVTESADDIYRFLKTINNKSRFKQVFTLNLEGGHPDHDALALIVSKFSKVENIPAFFVPAYNYEKSGPLPVSVFTPLASQLPYSKFLEISRFCWIDSLKVALCYRSEKSAFLKLIPFILARACFNRGVYILLSVDISFIDWDKSLTTTRYGVEIEHFLKKMEGYR